MAGSRGDIIEYRFLRRWDDKNTRLSKIYGLISAHELVIDDFIATRFTGETRDWCSIKNIQCMRE